MRRRTNVQEAQNEADIMKLKNRKAVGLNEIPAEALKSGGITTVKFTKKIINEIWILDDRKMTKAVGDI